MFSILVLRLRDLVIGMEMSAGMDTHRRAGLETGSTTLFIPSSRDLNSSAKT
jgi:hypothetical protein